ncbi:MAG TPA: hypothetical protein DCP92_16530 [Nitrospiraceae bacterium]|jgi:hypothetical protein|nr:hypothetical protein [Nitrospiraceae bacterium]
MLRNIRVKEFFNGKTETGFKMRKPYCATLVAVEKSRADIRKLLRKYAATNVRLADEKRGLSLRFSLV